MSALIENTLQIISKISFSKKGYLLQLSDQGYKVIKCWGGNREEFEQLNEVIYKLHKNEVIDINKLVALPQVSKFISKNSICQIMHLPFPASRSFW